MSHQRQLDSDPAVMRYLSGGEPTAPQVVRKRHLPNILAGYEKWGGSFGLFAAHEKESCEFIGWFILRPQPAGPLGEIELGYRRRQSAWGNRYATEGSRALLDKAFTELGVRLVWAETLSGSHGSRNVSEKLSMTLVDTIPVPPEMQMIEGSEQGGVR